MTKTDERSAPPRNGVARDPAGDFLVRLRDGRELAGSRRFRRPLLAD